MEDMRRGLEYDPWVHADVLEVPVTWRQLEAPGGRSRWGLYVHGERRVYLAPGLSDVEARCTLAHELVHAIHGHQPARPRLAAAQERQANRDAYGLLVDPDELAAAELEHGGEEGAVARALRVIPEVLAWHR